MPQYITDALREFAGTPEEVRVTIADCQMAIARGDVEGALKRLRKIPANSPHYPKAQMAMADIYLKYRRNKAAYIKCYMDLKVFTDTRVVLNGGFVPKCHPLGAVSRYRVGVILSSNLDK